MIQALFFLRFKTQLQRTRPRILAGLEDAFRSAVSAAGGESSENHRLLSASFNENRIGFLIDMLLLIESLKKRLEEAGRELSGHALIIGENIPDEGRERLCRALSSGAVSGFSGIWCGEALRKAMEPYGVFENRFEEYGELKELVNKGGPEPQFPARERIGQALLQKTEGNVLFAGPPFAGKRGGVYHFCKNLMGEIPLLVIRFGSGNPACFADAMTDEIRSFLSTKPGEKSETSEELDALGEFLFRERIRSELFPAELEAARRFLKLLLVSYGEAARAHGVGQPAVILENIPLSGEITSSVFQEVYSSLERRQPLLVFGTCSLPKTDHPAEAALQAEEFMYWGKVFPTILKFSSRDFPPLHEKTGMPYPLWEAAYVFALLGRFFPPRLFPKLFEEEGLNPAVPKAAAEMLKAAGLIHTEEDPIPRIPDFTIRAEKRLAEAPRAGDGISGKDRILSMVRNRLLSWVDSGKVSPCFALLGILNELGSKAGGALILMIIRGDVFTGACVEIGEFAEKNGFLDYADSEGSRALLWIYRTLKALVWEDEKEIEKTFSSALPEAWRESAESQAGVSFSSELPANLFAGFKAQLLVNLGAYKLGRGELKEAGKALKEAMLLNQSLRDRAVSSYRLFSLVNLAGNHLGDALEYALFAADQAERSPGNGKNLRPDEFEEQVKVFYFAAVIHFLYGNLSKAEQFAVKAEEAVVKFGRPGIPVPGLCPEWAAKARFLRGRLKFETGSYGEALELFGSLSGGPLLFMREPSDRDKTIAAWIYRAQIFASGFKGPPEAKPDFPSSDGQLFTIEAAFLSGDFEKVLFLADGFFEGKSSGLSGPECGKGDFFFTEQPDWRSGFSQCENVITPGGESARRLAWVYRSLAKCGLGVSGREKEEMVKEWQEFFRGGLLPDGDPGDSFYYYAYYCILEKIGASRIDMGTTVSVAFKRFQRRAGRIEDNKTRQSFVSANHWNGALCLAAKEYKLI